jgi:N6-L-threonylcarbamoyladenine synthase
MALILGVETSCDETASAVVEDGRRILSSVVASQTDLHERFGGVVPEIASRAHVAAVTAVMEQALVQAGVKLDGVDALAVTNRPGLIGALLVGVSAAKAAALAAGKPVVAVDHVAAHLYAAHMAGGRFPCVALVASGGHTSLYLCHDALRADKIAATVDDAAGEAFDKVAAILGLGFPGGPAVERAASGGRPQAGLFKTNKKQAEGMFSFSGIKTAVLYHVRDAGGLGALSKERVAEVAASFQETVVGILVGHTVRAARDAAVRDVAVGGGVAANGRLRDAMSAAAEKEGLTLTLPPMALCTDNAAMIAGLGYHLFLAGEGRDLSFDASARV